MDFPISETVLVILGAGGIGAWVLTTWMRIKNGYPLENSWGKALHPKHDPAALERVKLLTQENAELRAEIGSMKDRLANVERIVTDGGYGLSGEIEKLRSDGGVSIASLDERRAQEKA